MKRQQWRGLAAVVALAVWVSWGDCGAHSDGYQYRQVPLWITNSAGKRVKVVCRVADTPDKRARGLMYQRHLEPGRGMLFVFERERKVSFWMKNTYIPLSIAFISRNRRIVALDTMEPLTRTLHSSPEAVKYALEVPQGFFQRHGIKVGDLIEVAKP